MVNQRHIALLLLIVLILASPVRVMFGQEQGARKAIVRVTPTYPDIAKRMHLNGKVRLEVTVAPSGAVTKVRALGGHPALLQCSQDAVKQWKFESGGETTETVVFTFALEE